MYPAELEIKGKEGGQFSTLEFDPIYNDIQQIVGIPMGTNCAPLLADIFLYSYEAEFIVYALNWNLHH